MFDVESDLERKNGRGSVVDIDLLKAALETHRAPIHALRNGNGAWDMGCDALHEYEQAVGDRQ